MRVHGGERWAVLLAAVALGLGCAAPGPTTNAGGLVAMLRW